MDDVIYRQEAIDTLTTECSWTFYDEHGQLTPNGEEILGALKKIPSAQRWILCSERMPYYDEEILVSYRGRVRIASRTRNDKEYPWYIIDGRFNVNTVDAWMPRPKPYGWKTDE